MHESAAVPSLASSGSLQLDGSSSSSANLSIATEAEEEEGEATDGEPASISMDDGGININNDSTSTGGDDGLGSSGGGSGDDGALRQDAQFDERLRELEEFKAKYGHCRVPQVWKENKRLGQWVATTRNLKKAGKLPLERVKLLEGVGFVWCCRNVTAASKGEKRKMIPWNERFEELKVFKDKYGHCNVPHKWSENVKLSNWLYCQRSFHRHGKLSQDKIKRLESIGFEWSKQDPPAASSTAAAVVLVKKRKSSTSPSPSPSSAYDLTAIGAAGQPPAFAPAGMDHGAMLAAASLDIHHHHHQHQQHHQQPHHHQQTPQPLVVGHHVELLQPAIGQGSAIATDQKDRLMLGAAAAAAATLTAVPKADGENENENEDEGEGEEGEEEEVVVYRPSSVKERKSWYERYQELLAFKQEHGHCNVPWKWRENLPLFYWVRRMKDKKRANALTAEKVALMEEIGFEWVKGQNKEKERRKQQQILIEQKQKELEEEREGLVAAAVRARLLSGNNNGNPAAADHHHHQQPQQPPQSNGVGGAAAGSVAELIAAQQQQGVGEQVGMMSPFAYNFPASYATAGTGGALVSTTYYPVYAKLTSAGASSTGEFTFDPTALAGSSSGVELSMDHNGQHSLYSHAHSDLGAALQHFMGEEMKEGDKEEGMEGMGDALHHHHHHEDMHHEEMVHHHHHLHAMHHVTVSEADGSVHMVEVIQNEPGHLDMSEMSFHEGMPEEEEEGHHHHHHQEGEHVGQSSMGEMPANNSQPEDQTAGEEDAYTTYHHHHHTQEDHHNKADQ